MKLHRVEITAFGPFAGHEVVDFDTLNEAGVFLLNGETGAGKTSVLDAICFALYGSGPTSVGKGGRKAQHSDHADPHTAPAVEVEFTASGRRWCVTRSPAWREPSTRAASGWSERHATVSLRELCEGQWVDRGYRPDDVGQTIHHAVGLDREQFTQVMMLPQGKFAQFLQAGSREREDLLETLFGTDVYADVQLELKTRADAAKGDLAAARVDVERSQDLLARLRARLAQTVEQLPPSARPVVADHEEHGTEPREQAAPDDAKTTDTERASHAEEKVADRDPGHVPHGSMDLAGQWDALLAECTATCESVTTSRDRADEAHVLAARRVVELESLTSLVERHEALSRRRAELSQNEPRVATSVHRLEEHAAATELGEPLRAAAAAQRRAAEAGRAVEELRAALVASEGRSEGRKTAPPSDREDAPTAQSTVFSPGSPVSADLPRGQSGTAGSLLDVLPACSELAEEIRNSSDLPRGLLDAAVSARESARSAVERERDLVREETTLRRDRDRCQELETRATGVDEELAMLRASLVELEAEHTEAAAGARDEGLVRDRARAAAEAVDASRDYSRARAAAEDRAQEYETAEVARRAAADRVEALEARRFAGAAASLARELADGDPCPVCGATAHPHLASVPEGQDVPAGAIERARSDRDAAQETADAAHDRWQAAQRTSLEHLARGADEDLDAAVERARAARQAEEVLEACLARLRAVEQRIAAARSASVELEDEHTSLATDLASLRSTVASSEQRCATERDHLARLLGPFPSAEARLRVAEDLVRVVNRWEDAQQELDTARNAQRLTQGTLDSALQRSPFDAETEVTAALLPDEEAVELTSWVTRIQQESAAVGAELATQEMQRAAALTAAQREEITREALDMALARQRETQERRDRLNRHLGGLEALTEDVRGHAGQAPECERVLGTAAERAERLSGLADVATATSSENALRMTLTSFVLAAKLEQVAAVASEHLARMSSGRFTLVHTDQTRGSGKSGLGLEIEDAWTGVRRGTETLSGGESFFTSLALALALADVVRAEAGGTEIDTLFVDEGFGSLDEQTLEQVLETLDGLRRGGRVIGVVSHVSEMKQRIETQLVVTKTPQGSHLAVETATWAAPVG